VHICAQKQCHRKHCGFSLAWQQLIFSHVIQQPYALSSQFRDTLIFRFHFIRNSRFI